jgi:hypothetical protein
MKKIIYIFLLVGFSHLIYGLLISTWSPHVFTLQLTNQISNAQFFDYAGVINVHTNKSSGSGDIETIMKAANNSDLKFIVISDHNDFKPDQSIEKYYDNVLAMIGGDYRYLDARFTNFDFQNTEHLQGPGRSQMLFADILSHDNRNRTAGIFVLAQPFDMDLSSIKSNNLNFDGIELLNLKNIWHNAWLDSRVSFIWSVFLYPFNSRLTYIRILAHSADKEILLWDKLNLNNKVRGYYSSDADAKLRWVGNSILAFPSYETLFSILSNHILIKSELTGNAYSDRKKISAALHGGQFYLSADILQNPKGFEAFIKGSKNFIAPLGAEIKFQKNLEYIINLPEKPILPFETILYKDGEKILASNSVSTNYAIQGPGVYRSIVRLKITLPFPDRSKWVNWILTNPIYIE